MEYRASGILLHITSLPSSHGIGDLGEWAYRFTDFMAEAGQSYWQILPLNPTDPVHGNSPYSSASAFAGNILLIAPELMVRDSLLTNNDLAPIPHFPGGSVDYNSARKYKERLFRKAVDRFQRKTHSNDYKTFCTANAHWLDDFSLFTALKSNFDGKSWHLWPEKIRDRDPSQLQKVRENLQNTIEKVKILQYIFFKQWFSLKDYSNKLDIRIIGDIPIYVNYDSADVWSNREIFKLDDDGTPLAVAGVPPDYFSKTGQLWGNPVYRWDVLKDREFGWWVERFRHNLKLYDLIRIDHFRGYVKYWEVPPQASTAKNGMWVTAPADEFFAVLNKKFPSLPVFVEDLGKITPDVEMLLNRLGFPGIRPILFAFSENLPRHKCAPHNIEKNSVAYTGTHDCNTVLGWFHSEASRSDKARLFRYLGRRIKSSHLHREMVRLAMGTAAQTVIIPMQDILGLGEEARMNLPGTATGNWRWQLLREQITPSLGRELKSLTEMFGRV